MLLGSWASPKIGWFGGRGSRFWYGVAMRRQPALRAKPARHVLIPAADAFVPRGTRRRCREYGVRVRAPRTGARSRARPSEQRSLPRLIIRHGTPGAVGRRLLG